MSKQIRFVIAVAFLVTLPRPALACLNDRDTLAAEAQRRPDVLRAITGRFERNPAMYYEMRIARLKVELAHNPTLLSDYDDIAVALDRLGYDTQAIAWIDRKLVRLPKFDSKNHDISEEWYRYYANSGTFHVHRWIHDGADSTQYRDLSVARQQIEKAIAIKPTAHFGREKYQLKVIDWLIQSRVKGPAVTLATALDGAPRDECITALAGLIALGNAWESVDIYEALAEQLGQENHALADLAELRAEELRKSGHKSLVTDNTAPHRSIFEEGLINETPYIYEQFASQRAEADRWQTQRTQYMMGLLQRGRHPDTDPAFWNGWHDSGPPVIVRPPGHYDGLKRLVTMLTSIFIGLIVAAPFAVAVIVGRRKSRKPTGA